MNRPIKFRIEGDSFPLNYWEWCKTIKKIKLPVMSEDIKLIREFYDTVWKPAGKEMNGIDFGIVTGRLLTTKRS